LSIEIFKCTPLDRHMYPRLGTPVIGKTVVIAEIVIGEFCCTSKVILQRMLICPKTKP